MSVAPCSEAELIRRYGGSVPRYTSYPSALQFVEGFGQRQLVEALQRADASVPPSLYLHVPFCTAPCFYCACTRIINRRAEPRARYVELLLSEIRRSAGHWPGRTRGVAQLHFGGGTPTSLDDAQLAALMTALDQHFGLSAEATREYSIEVDPRTVDAERLRVLAGLGLNRISLGVQDLDPAVQQAINREQPLSLVATTIAAARGAGFRSIATDLIYGLPRQTPASFARTLDAVAALRPDRIAIYAYAHLPQQFAAQRQIRAGELPDAATRLALLQLGVERLGAAGYRRIGMDHFALVDDELARADAAGTLQRNFQGYSTQAGHELLGFGLSAISRVADVYAQNAKQLADYAQRIEQGQLPVRRGLRLDADDLLRRDVIEQIMCAAEVDFAAIAKAHGVTADYPFHGRHEELQALLADGLIELEGSHLRVLPRGRPLVRNIARVFDRYAPAAPAERHSAAI